MSRNRPRGGTNLGIVDRQDAAVAPMKLGRCELSQFQEN